MLRKACLEDASRLAEILIFAKRTAYRNIFNNDKVSFGEMQVLPLALEFINHPQLLKSIYVYDDEFIKGMSNIKETLLTDDTKCIEVKELYIDPFFQGYGIGGTILNTIISNAKNDNAQFISLWVLEKNEKARYFYEKFGLHVTSERMLQEGTPEYLVKYVLHLNN